MLAQLRIKNYALIDELEIEYCPNLNVLTGETGAGKSIVIGALSLLLGVPQSFHPTARGKRAESEMIRTGANACEIEGTFTVDPSFFNNLGDLPIEKTDTILIRRKVESNGRSYSYINDQSVTTNTLKRLGDFLVDLAGQHEHQSLLKIECHRDILDDFAKLLPRREDLQRLFIDYQSRQRQLANLTQQIQRRKERRELDEFQYQEIATAQLKSGEEEVLLKEKVLLESAEKRFRLASAINQILSENEGSLLEQFDILQKQFTELASIDEALKATLNDLKGMRSVLDELWRTIARYQDRIEFSPQRLEAINERLFLIEKLKKKYNRSVEELLGLKDELAKNLNSIEIDESQIKELTKDLADQKARLIQLAQEISLARQRAKSSLEAKLEKELAELGMPQARFIITIQPIEDETGLYEKDGKKYRLDETGIDQVEFFFSANPGEEPKPLRKVASGGELSRIMLALKSIISGRIPVLVFDEIDLGIGGKIAETVGQKLAKLAQKRQVICITHLPVIAKYADAHYRVSKEIKAGRTRTVVKHLSEPERVSEIARMLAGAKISKTTISHATEMLKEAKT